MILPRFVALKSNYNNKYLGYVPKEEFKDIHQGVEPTRKSFLRFYISSVDSPYTKFEVQMAEIGDGLVHLKCCYNNNYLVRWSQNHWWIVAAAQEPEEDKLKWSCTLFKPVIVDGNAKTVRFLHVQLGHYACLLRHAPPFGDCLFGESKDFNKDSRDVVTVIDWDSLLVKFEPVALPRFVALKSKYNDKYLGYVPKEEFKDIHQGVEPTRKSFLRFYISSVDSPYTKFEVQMAEIGNGLVHLKCCYNNKYWVRWSPNHWWIVAAAQEPEEDKSKWSCTLFKPIYVDGNAKTIRFLHIQLGHYACLWRIGAPFGDCLFGGSNDPNGESCDIITIIDWDSLLIKPQPTSLPRYVVFKSNYNNKYLGYVPKYEFKDIDQGVEPTRNSFLQFFITEDVSPYTKFELHKANIGNGLVHIRCCYNNKYWVRWSKNHWWIVAAADEPEEDQSKWSCTLFNPIYVDRDAKTVRFMHVQLGHYACLLRHAPPFGDCLFGESKDVNKDSCDVVTIIDWDSLLTKAEPVALPRFVVLKSSYNNKYLGYVHKDEFKDIHQGVVPTRNCFLRFSRDEVVSPYTKFEVKTAKSGNGLVHLRCCYNNKYWVRWSKNHSWIVAAAHEPEEDRSKWSCTLFKPIYVDRDAKTVRFLHVQLGHYACLLNHTAPFGGCLFGEATDPDHNLRDVVTIIDWESQVASR